MGVYFLGLKIHKMLWFNIIYKHSKCIKRHFVILSFRHFSCCVGGLYRGSRSKFYIFILYYYIYYIYYPLAELNFKHFTYKKLCISLIFSKLEVSNNKILKIRYAQLEYNIT